jgi:dephospho-CoA kinase
MLWIGITGPIGSGKSTVSEILRQMGYPVLDADRVVHKITGPGSVATEEIVRTFGESLRDQAGNLDRRALGRAVFGDPAKLEQLEKILHPRVREQVALERKALSDMGHKAAFYDVPLLFEKKMEAMFNRILVVSAPEDVRRQRVMSRSGLTAQEFDERQKRQLPAEEKEKKASAVIMNSGDLAKLKMEVESALKFLKIPLPAAANP